MIVADLLRDRKQVVYNLLPSTGKQINSFLSLLKKYEVHNIDHASQDQDFKLGLIGPRCKSQCQYITGCFPGDRPNK